MDLSSGECSRGRKFIVLLFKLVNSRFQLIAFPVYIVPSAVLLHPCTCRLLFLRSLLLHVGKQFLNPLVVQSPIQCIVYNYNQIAAWQHREHMCSQLSSLSFDFLHHVILPSFKCIFCYFGLGKHILSFCYCIILC